MYKRHGMQLGICICGISVIAYLLNLNFTDVAGIAITVTSISMGVYIAAVSALLGSEYTKKLKEKTDDAHSTKTQLGVLANYFRWAGKWCILTMVISCMYQIPSVISFNIVLIKVVSSFAFGIFGVNFLFL